MIVFEGTYMLERKEDPGAGPISACAWLVKIIIGNECNVKIRSTINDIRYRLQTNQPADFCKVYLFGVIAQREEVGRAISIITHTHV